MENDGFGNRPGLLFAPSFTAIGIPHAFTTRVGGISSAPFDSLNFGNPSELPAGVERDSKTHIGANFELVKTAIGCADRSILQVHQVHGADVHVVRAGSKSAAPIEWGDVKADAIVTDDPQTLVAIRVADCVPVLLASQDGRIVASVHAGWRGVIAEVALRTVDAMRALGATTIIGAIGPCISAKHFEVGREVLDVFVERFGQDAPITHAIGSNKGFVDLKESLRRQLMLADVSAVDVLPHCTFADSALFYSHRRDNGVTGRMVGIVGTLNAPRSE